MPDAGQNGGRGGAGTEPLRAQLRSPPPPPQPVVTGPTAITANSSHSLARADVGVIGRRHVRFRNSESGTRAMKRAFVTVGTTSFDDLVASVAAPDCVEVSPAQGSAVSAPLPFS